MKKYLVNVSQHTFGIKKSIVWIIAQLAKDPNPTSDTNAVEPIEKPLPLEDKDIWIYW